MARSSDVDSLRPRIDGVPPSSTASQSSAYVQQLVGCIFGGLLALLLLLATGLVLCRRGRRGRRRTGLTKATAAAAAASTRYNKQHDVLIRVIRCFRCCYLSFRYIIFIIAFVISGRYCQAARQLQYCSFMHCSTRLATIRTKHSITSDTVFSFSSMFSVAG